MKTKKHDLKQKGITLVSLAITIIIMLILAGVSIGVINEGVISDADEATKKYNNRIAKEEDALEDLMQKRNEIMGEISGEDNETESDEEVPVVPVLGFVVTFLIIAGQVFTTKENTTTLEFPEENPTKSGYDFTGWYYDEECTNKATEGAKVSANTTLYAGWQAVKVDIITNKQNGAILPSVRWGFDVQDKTILEYTTNKAISSCEIIEVNDEDYIDLDGLGSTATEADYNLTEAHFSFEVDSNDNKKAKILYLGRPHGTIYKHTYIKIRINFLDGTYDEDDFIINLSYTCLAEGTSIALKDGTKKAIEDITYEDELLVWDFDKGCLAFAKPLWIQDERKAQDYNLLKFENGSELKTISQHRIFSKDLGKFTYPMTDETPIGTTTITSEGKETKLVSKEVVSKEVKYYNIITNYHMNLFANDILTSCRLSNLYPIKDMKYVMDKRQLTPREEYKNIPDNYFTGLRLAEQPKEINRGNDIKHDNSLEEYVTRLINTAKKV